MDANRSLASYYAQIISKVSESISYKDEPTKTILRSFFRTGLNGAHLTRALYSIHNEDEERLNKITMRSFSFSAWIGLLDYVVDEREQLEVIHLSRSYLEKSSVYFPRSFNFQLARRLMSEFLLGSSARLSSSCMFEKTLKDILDYVEFSCGTVFTNWSPSVNDLSRLAHNTTKYLWGLYALADPNGAVSGAYNEEWSKFEYGFRIFTLLDDISDLVRDFERNRYDYLLASILLDFETKFETEIRQAIDDRNLKMLCDIIVDNNLLRPVIENHFFRFLKFVHGFAEGNQKSETYVIRLATLESLKALEQLRIEQGREKFEKTFGRG